MWLPRALRVVGSVTLCYHSWFTIQMRGNFTTEGEGEEGGGEEGDEEGEEHETCFCLSIF